MNVVYSRTKLKEMAYFHNAWLQSKPEGVRADFSYATTSVSFANVSKSWAGANFRSAKLKGADLSYADLTGCNFAGADLEHARFSGCILKGANFRSANLRGTYFNSAILHQAEFYGAVLRMTGLIGAQFTIELAHAAEIHGVSIEKKNLFLLFLNKKFVENPVYHVPTNVQF
jgi:uncharacterized protein YjbI with pentapeptide repeats